MPSLWKHPDELSCCSHAPLSLHCCARPAKKRRGWRSRGWQTAAKEERERMQAPHPATARFRAVAPGPTAALEGLTWIRKMNDYSPAKHSSDFALYGAWEALVKTPTRPSKILRTRQNQLWQIYLLVELVEFCVFKTLTKFGTHHNLFPNRNH